MPRRPRRARIYKGSVEDFIRWEINPFAYLSGFERPAHSLWSDASASAFFRRHEKEIRETAEREGLARELDQWIKQVLELTN